MEGVNIDQPKFYEAFFFVNVLYVGLKLTKLSAQKHLRQKRMCINLFFLFQSVNTLKMSDHEEPSFSLMSKNQMRRNTL